VTQASAKARASSSSRRVFTTTLPTHCWPREEGAKGGASRLRLHQRAGALEIRRRLRSRSMRRSAAASPMTAPSRSAASSAATPFISRSSRSNPRAASWSSPLRANTHRQRHRHRRYRGAGWARARMEEQDKGAMPRAPAGAHRHKKAARKALTWPAPEPTKRARPTNEAPPVSPPCRRFTRWISQAPA